MKQEKKHTPLSAYLDLALGILLILSLAFPQVFFGFVDARLNALIGVIFLVLLVGRGGGAIIALIMIGIVEKIFRSIGKWYLTSFITYVRNTFLVFLVSYLEGMVIMLIFGMMMLIANAATYVAHIQAPEIFAASAAFLEPVAHDTLGWFVSDKSEVAAFVLGVLLTAFSFLALYLIKAYDFSFVKKLGFPRKATKEMYEKLLRLTKGEDVEIGPLLS
ncbi:MAG: hypothetical protein PHF60_04150 [Candidatus ainarchaeum sp.]|nr:hypothetical protein [Candidatus ainarchaeum sp.]